VDIKTIIRINKFGKEKLIYVISGDKDELCVLLGPLLTSQEWQYPVARMVAKEHEVVFEESQKSVFYAVKYNKNDGDDELEEKIKRLIEAEEKLEERFELLAEFIMELGKKSK